MPQIQYEKLLIDLLGKRKLLSLNFFSQKKNINLFIVSSTAYKFQQIGPIYYEYGSLIITYDKADIAVKAFYKLRDSSYPEQKKDTEKEDKNLLVLLLPSISDAYLDPGVKVIILLFERFFILIFIFYCLINSLC